jgi:hypothetical protein
LKFGNISVHLCSDATIATNNFGIAAGTGRRVLPEFPP